MVNTVEELAEIVLSMQAEQRQSSERLQSKLDQVIAALDQERLQARHGQEAHGAAETTMSAPAADARDMIAELSAKIDIVLQTITTSH